MPDLYFTKPDNQQLTVGVIMQILESLPKDMPLYINDTYLEIEQPVFQLTVKDVFEPGPVSFEGGRGQLKESKTIKAVIFG